MPRVLHVCLYALPPVASNSSFSSVPGEHHHSRGGWWQWERDGQRGSRFIKLHVYICIIESEVHMFMYMYA